MIKFLRRPEVEHRTGLGRSTLYAKMADGSFPKPVKLGKRAVGWPEDRIQAWMDACLEAGEDAVK
jgi:prophage regulatory protein